jgi:hypothetical protein
VRALVGQPLQDLGLGRIGARLLVQQNQRGSEERAEQKPGNAGSLDRAEATRTAAGISRLWR